MCNDRCTGVCGGCELILIGVQVFVMALLQNLVENEHRTLVFSQSRVMLDILQADIQRRGTRFVRIDGSIVSPQQRQDIVDQFQRDDSISVFLLSSQVHNSFLSKCDRISCESLSVAVCRLVLQLSHIYDTIDILARGHDIYVTIINICEMSIVSWTVILF